MSSFKADCAQDRGAEQAIQRYLNTLPEKTNTLRLFERSSGDYFSVHGDDAHHVARQVFKTPTVIKYPNGLPTCTMSRTVAETYMRTALLSQRVEIYRHDQDAGGWALALSASPGNLQAVEDMLFQGNSMGAPPLVAVKVGVKAGQIFVGVASIDQAGLAAGVCEFLDNDVLSNLEALVIQLGARECLVEDTAEQQSTTDVQRRLMALLERCQIVATECPRRSFATASIQQDLGRLLSLTAPVASLAELSLTQAISALACALDYLGLLSDESVHGRYTLSTLKPDQFMRLDASAVHALSLLHSPADGASKTMSLQGLLGRCKTSQGQRLLAQWLKQPLLDISKISERLDLVEVFFNATEMRETLRRTHLRAIPDLKRLGGRLSRGTASLQDIVRLHQVVETLPGFIDALSMEGTSDIVDSQYGCAMRKAAEDLQPFRELVETTVDLKMADQHEFILRADFDEGLEELRQQMDVELDQISQQLDQASRALDLEAGKKLKLEKHTTFGYCLRMSRGDSGKLRGKSKYFELSTLKTGVLFTTAGLRESSAKYKELSSSYSKQQQALVKQVIQVAASYVPVLEQLDTLVAHLDVILSFAESSATAPIPYVRPQVTPFGGNLRLVGARHPCVEVQDSVGFIANDAEMTPGSSEFIIITGPNMGGKSTFIRQIGVIALMAQVGCFVPCEEAELPLFDCILARVGAGDAQMKGVSTFMAEMLETAGILKTATSNSLVIIDELGRGTSTYDGFGLAWAISEHIVKEIKCRCLFATHFHELTELAKMYPGVDNKHVMASVGEKEGLTLLYKIGNGVCDQSFGIHVAQLANFPESVVNLAKRKAEELEDSDEQQQMDVAVADALKDGFSKEDMARGSKLIESFLTEFTATPGITEMESQQVAKRVLELQAKYETEIAANPWVQNIITTL